MGKDKDTFLCQKFPHRVRERFKDLNIVGKNLIDYPSNTNFLKKTLNFFRFYEKL